MKSLPPFCRLAVLLSMALTLSAPAAPQFFTDQISFNSAITGGATFTTNLSSLPAGPVSSPVTFSGNGMSVQAISTNTAEYGLYSFGNGLSVASELGYALAFTNFSSNTFAFGGLFFNINDQGNFLEANLILEALFADSSSVITNLPSVSTNSFFGFVGSTNIISLSVSGTAAGLEGGLATSSQVTFGAPVPEPATSTLLLVSLGALACAAARWRRRANH